MAGPRVKQLLPTIRAASCTNAQPVIDALEPLTLLVRTKNPRSCGAARREPPRNGRSSRMLIELLKSARSPIQPRRSPQWISTICSRVDCLVGATEASLGLIPRNGGLRRSQCCDWHTKHPAGSLQSSRATHVPSFPGDTSHLSPTREQAPEAAASAVPGDVRSDGQPLGIVRTPTNAAERIARMLRELQRRKHDADGWLGRGARGSRIAQAPTERTYEARRATRSPGSETATRCPPASASPATSTRAFATRA